MATLLDPSLSPSADLLTARVAMLVNPGGTICGQSLKAIAQMPNLSDDDVKAKVLDCILLALLGLTVIANGRVAVAAYPESSLEFLQATNRLQD
eukprot:7473678-Karenia_brevis.AAC.1